MSCDSVINNIPLPLNELVDSIRHRQN